MFTKTIDSGGVNIFPLDVAALFKGQIIGIEELEHIFHCRKADLTEGQWSLKLLGLRGKIERLRRRNGLPVLTMRMVKGALHICTDSVASSYNHTMGRRGIRRFKRATYRNIAVDATKLTPEERERHGRVIMRQAMIVSALRANEHRALLTPGPAERTTPKMIKGEKTK